MLQKHFWIKFLASFGFLGYSHLFPGTVGSLGGVFLYIVLTYFQVSHAVFAVFVVLFTFASIAVASQAEKVFAAKDPSQVVVDEVAGMMLTLWGVPFEWKWLLLGFIFFRALDIIKPYPARHCEHLHAGWGIVLDDIVSGFYAWVILQTIILLT